MAEPDDQPWGEGKVRPSEPEPRPPAVGRLGVWWAVAAAFVVGVAWAATDHMLRSTVTLAAGCFLGAGLRLLLPAQRAGGLIVRSRIVDVALLAGLGALILISGFALDLRARV